MLIYHDDFGTLYRFHNRWDASSVYGPRYAVADPRVVRQRVELERDSPNMLMVQAKRTGSKPVFEEPPQQSDYVSAWDAHEAAPEPAPARPVLPRVRRHLPARLRNQVAAGVALAVVGRSPSGSATSRSVRTTTRAPPTVGRESANVQTHRLIRRRRQTGRAVALPPRLDVSRSTCALRRFRRAG